MTARTHARTGGWSPRTGTDIRRRMGRAIDRNRTVIEARWLARVQQDVVNDNEVEATQLRDGLPDYLRSIVSVLDEGDKPVKPAMTEAWEQVAREHGVTRVRIGFDIGQLIRRPSEGDPRRSRG